MLPTTKFGEKNRTTPKTISCAQRRKTRIEVVEHILTPQTNSWKLMGSDIKVLDMFKSFTTTPEQPVNVSELLKSPARNTKADQNTMSQDHCQNFGQSKIFPTL